MIIISYIIFCSYHLDIQVRLIAISLKTNVSINILTSNFSNIRPPKGGPHIAVTPLTIPSKPKNQEELSKVCK